MTGLSGLNPPENALTLALVQQRIPLVRSRADIDLVVDEVCGTIRRIGAAFPSAQLLVFPEYGFHGLRKDAWARDDLMLDMDGPEVERLRAACADAGRWGCFSIMERNPAGAPFNSGIIVNDVGEIVLYQRKLHPWVPKEPWEPGDQGVAVCAGPGGSTLALIICHDGMFPEVAREAAYLGANVLLRTAGYKFPLRQSWRITNQANAFQNLAFTASVALAGEDGNSIGSMGEAMVCDFEGTVLAEGDSTPGRVLTVSIEPARADAARRTWGVENNIYQLGHRGYTAVRGGLGDCPYTFMRDLVAGRYRLPWEDEVRVTDGTADGYGPPRELDSPVDTARAGLREGLMLPRG
ncbi:formamidase [Nocardia sp. SYP-A9097]|uniref:formamidase n=1 Tax=Nocardia sp. SYP-A9097 TaxID=2663237 RepID=UPI00129B0455|nr:formamidase [Nocardia sp. SYP-A9097]MRH87922.1 formamidase [Nocardia sp. SYP-A9097]